MFTAIGPDGALATSAFALAGAVTAQTRVIYDDATGRLSYDRDGSGAGAAVLVATVDPATVVTASDLLVV